MAKFLSLDDRDEKRRRGECFCLKYVSYIDFILAPLRWEYNKCLCWNRHETFIWIFNWNQLKSNKISFRACLTAVRKEKTKKKRYLKESNVDRNNLSTLGQNQWFSYRHWTREDTWRVLEFIFPVNNMFVINSFLSLSSYFIFTLNQ